MMEIFAPQLVSFAKNTPISTPVVRRRPSTPVAVQAAAAHSFDPNATMAPTDAGQAIADELFAIRTDLKSA